MGAPIDVPADMELNGRMGRLFVNGDLRSEGPTDNPMQALAWLADLAAGRGRPLTAGMVVITGSVVATLGIDSGDRFRFELDGIGTSELSLDAAA